jgi:hypothetical protein
MYPLSKDLFDSIKSINLMVQQLENQGIFRQVDEMVNLHRRALTEIKPTLDLVNSIRIPTDEIVHSLNVYNQIIESFKHLDFSSLIKSQLYKSTKILETLRKPIFDFTAIGNQLNFDYLRFYTNSFDFDNGGFFDPESEEIDQKYIEKIDKYEKVRKSRFTEIKTDHPVILAPFKQDWYEILDKLKPAVENWYHKQIKKHSFIESDIQTGIASHLDFLENILNVGSVFFRFEKESYVSENGRVDFIFRFISPYREAPVEIKIIDKESNLLYYGTNQLVDYMKRRKYREGIRLVFNKTKTYQNHFEEDNIIHYFINLYQPSSSSLN